MKCLCRLVCPSGVIGSYLHASPAEDLGKMGALVALADRDGNLEGEAAEKAEVGAGSEKGLHSVCGA